MMSWVVNILAFLAVFLAVFAANAVVVDLHTSERKRLNKRLEEQLRQQQRERARKTKLPKEFSQIASDVMAENKGRTSIVQSLHLLIEQSGLDLTIERLLTYAGVCGAVLGLIAGLLFASVVAAMIGIAIGAATPIAYVHLKRARRLEKLREQLPDTFELMSRVMRVGQTVSQAMQAVADEFPRPISLEFLYCYEQMNLGLSPEAALRELGRRTGLLELRIFVLAVLVHRQTGGNLAELLDKLSHVVRERFRIRGMIRSLTAQGRFQAGILMSLPPFMFLLLFILHPEYEMILLDYPMLIAFGLGMMGLGALWIRNIVNFDF